MANIQNSNPTSTALKPILQTTFCVAISRNDFRAAAESLPKRIETALDEPSLSSVIRAIGEGPVIQFVAFELIKLAERISVSGNITGSSLDFIAQALVSTFPNESAADFKICFERGAIGQYGPIYRMDGIVLREWMEKYLEEKYQAIENRMMKEKDSYNVVRDIPAEYLQKMLDGAKAAPEFKKVAPMTDHDIRREGGVRPAKKEDIPNAEEMQVKAREHKERLRKAREATIRERHPDWTEDQINERLNELQKQDKP